MAALGPTEFWVGFDFGFKISNPLRDLTRYNLDPTRYCRRYLLTSLTLDQIKLT